MNISNTSAMQRLIFFTTSVLGFIGIYLSGYDQVHWFMYTVPVAYLFSAATGFCPAFAISKLILRRRPSPAEA